MAETWEKVIGNFSIDCPTQGQTYWRTLNIDISAIPKGSSILTANFYPHIIQSGGYLYGKVNGVSYSASNFSAAVLSYLQTFTRSNPLPDTLTIQIGLNKQSSKSPIISLNNSATNKSDTLPVTITYDPKATYTYDKTALHLNETLTLTLKPNSLVQYYKVETALSITGVSGEIAGPYATLDIDASSSLDMSLTFSSSYAFSSTLLANATKSVGTLHVRLYECDDSSYSHGTTASYEADDITYSLNPEESIVNCAISGVTIKSSKGETTNAYTYYTKRVAVLTLTLNANTTVVGVTPVQNTTQGTTSTVTWQTGNIISYSFPYYSEAGTFTNSLILTDDRGLSRAFTIDGSVTVASIEKTKLINFDIQRCREEEGAVILDAVGEKACITFGTTLPKYTSGSSTVYLTEVTSGYPKLYYKEYSASSYTSIDNFYVSADEPYASNKLLKNGSTAISVSQNSQYEFKLEINDSISYTCTVTDSLSKAKSLLHIQGDGYGVAFGKFSNATSSANKLESAWPIYADGEIYKKINSIYVPVSSAITPTETFKLDLNTSASGFLTSSSKSLRFTFYLSRPIDSSVSTVSVTGHCYIRGMSGSSGGYWSKAKYSSTASSDGFDFSAPGTVTVTTAIKDYNFGIITLIFTDTTTVDLNNNSPVSISGAEVATNPELTFTFNAAS